MNVQNLKNITKLFKSAAVWVIIFSCFIAGYGVWQDLSKEQPVLYSNNLSDIIINIKQDGHFHATVLVNNVEIEFLIDTGATHIVLSKEDAKKLDYDLSKLILSILVIAKYLSVSRGDLISPSTVSPVRKLFIFI